MPGLRYGLRLPSYITDPPDLTHQHKGAHHMQLPRDPDKKETLGFNAADGATQHQDTIPLAANRHDDIWPDADAYSSSRRGFETANAKCRVATRQMTIARDNTKSWLTGAKNCLTPTLGKKCSAAWAEAGWNENSLAIPNGEDKLMPMLRTQQTYLTAHPALAVADPRYNYTAARAGELLAALNFALTNANPDLGPIGVEPADAGATTSLNYRDLAEAALERRLHGLYAELEQKLDPLDPRWTAFGFEAPAAVKSPDAVTVATLEPLSAGKHKFSWPGAARSDRYQVHRQPAGTVGFKLFARTKGPATEILLEGLATGDLVKVRGVNAYEGPFSPDVTVA